MHLRSLAFVSLLALACDDAGSALDDGLGSDDPGRSADGGPADGGPGPEPHPGPVTDAGPPGAPDGGTTPDAGTPEPDAAVDSCATAPLGTIAGFALDQENGSGSFVRIQADVVWTLAASDSCVDRYVPSGEVTMTIANNEGETSRPVGPIGPADGELVVDRSTSPATYSMRGATDGYRWAAARGSFDRQLIAGGAVSVYHWLSWELRAEGAGFPPVEGCVGAAVDTVTTVSQSEIIGRATWTRVETTGCVDRYVPEGTARHPSPEVPSWCESATYSQTSGAITPEDYASLTIDRSRNPPRVDMYGNSAWETERTCTRADGSTETETVIIGGQWALVEMAFDGRRWSGALDIGPPPTSWSFTLQ